MVDPFHSEAERRIGAVWARAMTLSPISNEMRPILGLLLEKKNTIVFVSKTYHGCRVRKDNRGARVLKNVRGRGLKVCAMENDSWDEMGAFIFKFVH